MEHTPIYGSGLSLDSFFLLSLFVALGVYVIFTAILYYHWKTYSSDIKVTSLTLITYCATTLPLIILASVLALTF